MKLPKLSASRSGSDSGFAFVKVEAVQARLSTVFVVVVGVSAVGMVVVVVVVVVVVCCVVIVVVIAVVVVVVLLAVVCFCKLCIQAVHCLVHLGYRL